MYLNNVNIALQEANYFLRRRKHTHTHTHTHTGHNLLFLLPLLFFFFLYQYLPEIIKYSKDKWDNNPFGYKYSCKILENVCKDIVWYYCGNSLLAFAKRPRHEGHSFCVCDEKCR